MVSNRVRNIAFLSTYPPRECGLATFTQDLAEELDNIDILEKPQVIAISDGKYNYGDRVVLELMQHERDSYAKTARAVNNSNIELLVMEHEYGIYGGESGEYIIEFAGNLQVPFIVTLHTVLPAPTEKQKRILKLLGEKSIKVVTMARNTVPILENIYGIDASKIEVIHHGVPCRIVEPADKLKEKCGLAGRIVISTFGLLSPGKGLEYGIEAIAKVASRHNNIVYLILGETHPCVKKMSGETYREKLEDMVERLGIRRHVQFVNKYLSKDELIRYLKLTDIFMTPYPGKDQAVSGTLTYAIGYGKAIVSTPYSYAKEMLSEGRGLFAEFCSPDSLAGQICRLLENTELRKDIEKRALNFGRSLMWGNIAQKYTGLFIQALEENKLRGSMVV